MDTLIALVAAAQPVSDRTWVENASDIATVIIGMATVGALLVAAWSVREVRRDRALRVRPRLLFDVGGQAVRYEIKALEGIPGIDPGFAQQLLQKQHPRPTKAVHTQGWWGHLKNYGNGSALNAHITFLTLEARVGDETFALDAKKLADFPYMPVINTVPASPTHLLPGGESQFGRIPTPIFAGVEQRRLEVEGVVVVSYKDVFDNDFLAYQEWRTIVLDEDPRPELVMVFGEEYTPARASDLLAPVMSGVPKSLRPVVTTHTRRRPRRAT